MNKFLILTTCALLLSTGIADGLKGHHNSKDEVNVVEGPVIDGNFGKIDDYPDNTGSENSDDPDPLDDDRDDKPMNELAKSCFSKILSPSVSCIMRSMSKWEVSPMQMRRVHNSRPVCCAIWQMTGCMTTNSQTYCTSDERSAFLLHMSQETERRNHRNCSDIPYDRNDCSAGPAEAHKRHENADNYYSDVIFRRNNRIVNDNELRRGFKEALEDPDLPNDEPIQEQNKQDQNEYDSEHGDEQVEAVEVLDDLSLAQKLLDRVDRITVNQFVIDLHPVHNRHKHHRNAIYRRAHKEPVVVEPVVEEIEQ